MNVFDVLEERFKSGNDVPVTRASITREEYDRLMVFINGWMSNSIAGVAAVRKLKELTTCDCGRNLSKPLCPVCDNDE